jgi:hypothetical protein
MKIYNKFNKIYLVYTNFFCKRQHNSLVFEDKYGLFLLLNSVFRMKAATDIDNHEGVVMF